jgi:hypothetical protein
MPSFSQLTDNLIGWEYTTTPIPAGPDNVTHIANNCYEAALQIRGMEVPDLLTQRLDSEPRNGVPLEGEAVAVFTRDRTFIYREESLLSDAAVEVYSNDIERLAVSQGRRKTTFHLEYIDDTRQFAVSNSHAEAMLEGLFGGILAAAGLLDDDEDVRGVYLFSDLTVVVTDTQLVKHIGASVWDSDSETYPFDAVTGLDFEEGDVATQVVLWVDGRPERIKAPSEEAPLLQRTLTRALCEFHGVDSLEQLNETVGTEPEEPAPNSSIALEEGISPLIESTEEDSTEPDAAGAVTDDDWLEPDPGGNSALDTGTGDTDTGGGDTTGTASGDGEVTATADDAAGADIERLDRQVEQLTRAIERQNELLERQTRQLAELVERIDGG